ncbi:MAG TPA: response regulator [Ktedonobacterales bacterium]
MAAEEIHREHHLRVLVVEGNAAARLRVQATLADSYSLRFASGIAEAMDILQTEIPDLMVSEVDLPDGSGLSLCEHVRSQPCSELLPIMLLTSRDGINDKVAGFQAGADDYVVKPLDERLFPGRLRLLYRIKRLQHHQRDISA